MAKSGVTVVPGWTDMNDFWQWHNPLPTWYDTPVFTPPAGYDLFVSNRKYHTSPFGLGGVSANPWLHEVAASTNPYLHVIMINSATAKSKGISDGDMVWVESQYGKLQAKAKVTDTVHPEVVASIGNYGAHSTQLNPIAQIGINYNQLLTSDEGYFEPVAGGIDNTTRVKVYKA